MTSAVRDWICLTSFASIPIWSSVPSDHSWAVFGLLAIGLDAIAQYGYPVAYARLDSKGAWIRSFSLNLATCAVVCDVFTGVEGWQWGFLYITIVARWANPVLEANKNKVDALVETYRIKKKEPQRLLHGVLVAPAITTILMSLFWNKNIRGYQLVAIWLHFILSARFVVAAFTYFNISDKKKPSIQNGQKEIVVGKKD